MPDPDLDQTLILDIVRLDQLTKELDRRFRLNPTVQISDLLVDMPAEERAPYAAQLEIALHDIKRHHDFHSVRAEDDLHAADDDLGASLQQSLMATAMFEHEFAGEPTDATLLLPAIHAGGSTKPATLRATTSKAGSSNSGSDATEGTIASSIDSGQPQTPTTAPEKIEQFRILRELGAGAFGVVYLAEDEQLQRKVAIKMPKVSEAKHSAAYLNEARKAAAIDCKGIVPIYHIGSTESGVPFVVQKLIDGPSMRLLLTRHKRLPPAHAATLMRDIALALSAAHRLGIYHRDLKPDNILIDSQGVPWIADFGLAISESEQAKRKGEIAGTLLYMSPEQIQGRAEWLDGRSDLWALGVMLHELLTGKPPFNGRNRKALMEQICEHEPAPLQETAAELALLDDVFRRCCAKSPEHRYPTVNEFADDLTALIEIGLSVESLDGSELRSDTPISQYTSIDSRSTRASGPVSGRFLGSTQDSQLATVIDSGRLADGSLSDTALPSLPNAQHDSAAASLYKTPHTSLARLGEQWLRIAFFIIGTISLGIFGWIQWRSSTVISQDGSGNVLPDRAIVQPKQGSVDPAAMIASDLAISSEPIAPPSAAMKSTIEHDAMNSAVQPGADAAATTITNRMTLADADGSKEKPWVVAADGSGSHRSIKLALSTSKPHDWIRVQPGVYEEALKLTSPVHLLGGGDVKSCIITNAHASPIQIECSDESISIDGITIRGTGIQAGKEFNAINVVSGKLTLTNCELRSSTWNCVKVQAGSTLEAIRCIFQESDQFSVSAKLPEQVQIDSCDFFASGVQCVAGNLDIARCRFWGRQGISLQESTETPCTVVDCTFTNCAEYAVAITQEAQAIVRKCKFKNCDHGMIVGQSRVLVEEVTLDECKNAAIAVTGGRVDVKGATAILNARKFGCQVVGAELNLTGSKFETIGQSAIIASGPSNLNLQDVTFKNCSTSAIDLMQGTLTLQGGSIEESEEFGVFIAAEAKQASIHGTRFTNNLGGAISFSGGDGDLRDIVIQQSEIGVLARNGSEKPIQLTLQNLQFSEISGMAIDLEGDVIAEAKLLDFGDVPNDRRIQQLSGAELKQ